MFEENNQQPVKPEVPETPEGDDGQKPEIPEGGEGAVIQPAELEALKSQLQTKEELLKKQEKEINQQRFVIGKHDKILKKLQENGVEIPEDDQSGISEDRVSEIVGNAVKPLHETIEKLGNTISELARSTVKSNSGGGGAGQKPTLPPQEPSLPPAIKDQVKRLGLQWTGKGKVYKSLKTGKFYDYADESGGADINY